MHRDHADERDDVAHDRDDAGREDLADRLHVAAGSASSRARRDCGRRTRPAGAGRGRRARPACRGRLAAQSTSRNRSARSGGRTGRRGSGRTGPRSCDSPGQSPLRMCCVDGDLDEVRLDEVHRGQEREQARRQGDRAPVRSRVAPDPPRQPRVVDATDGVVVLPRPDGPRGSSRRLAWDRPTPGQPPRGSTRAAAAATAARRARPGRGARRGSLLDEPPLVQHHDAVEHGRDPEPVGDHERRALADPRRAGARGSSPPSPRPPPRTRRPARGFSGRGEGRARGSPAGAARRTA